MSRPSRLFPLGNILGPPSGSPPWIFSLPLSLNNPSTCPGIHVNFREYRVSCRKLTPATGWCSRQISYQRVIFLDRPHATWNLVVYRPLFCSLRIGSRGFSPIHVIPGHRSVSRRKVVRSSGSHTVPSVSAHKIVPHLSSCMRCTFSTAWGTMPTSILPLCPKRSRIRHRSCLRSGTPLLCQPLPRPAIFIHRLLLKLALLPWTPLVMFHPRCRIFHAACACPRIRAPWVCRDNLPSIKSEFLEHPLFVDL